MSAWTQTTQRPAGSWLALRCSHRTTDRAAGSGCVGLRSGSLTSALLAPWRPALFFGTDRDSVCTVR
eukprot:2835101-Pyramimonas_sp.AAC.1